MSKKFVYFFGREAGVNGKNLTEGKKEMKELLGGKGAGLAEMGQLGIRISPGFTITTELCKLVSDSSKMELPKEAEEEIYKNLVALEKVMGTKFGDSTNPLLVSVRSGAAVSMPGMMDTILNLGLNDVTVEGLSKKSNNPKFAYDSYRRLLNMFGDVVMGVDKQRFSDILEAEKKKVGAQFDKDLGIESLKFICQEYKKLIKQEKGMEFPQDVKKQLWMAIEAVFKSWNNSRAITYRRLNKITGLIGTAVNICAMIFGNLNDNSGTGVAFSRSPSTGENKLYGEILVNAQGEDVVAGIRTPLNIDQMKKAFPEPYAELEKVYKTLEANYKDMQDMEFTIQDGTLYMLQCRNGKRTAHAAVKIAVDMVKEGLIDEKTAITRIGPDQLDHLLHKMVDPKAKKGAKLLGKGIAASPGAAVGKIAFNNEQAVEFKKNNQSCILVRSETSPEDLIGMDAAVGILTSTGGKTSHAAVVARTMGKTCVSGCSAAIVREEQEIVEISELTLKLGDFITLDGTEGEVYLGKLNTVEPSLSGDFDTLMSWEKKYRKINVRANADTPLDAQRSIAFGAEGIGLCRTEHMFFAKDKIKAVREMILAKDLKGRQFALEKVKPYQKQDFIEIFRVMKEKPVTIRLLDPPLHEFLPREEEDLKILAKEMKLTLQEVKDKCRELHEANPMLGFRGCRLGIVFPEITQMQAEAIFEAVYQVGVKEGVDVHPEIMIPLVGTLKEFLHQKELLKNVATKILGKESKIKYLIGTMIETPRAAIVSGEISKEAEFFSFGSNDLTQMTFGYSRDDSGTFISHYEQFGILPSNPFQTLDQEGVGFLMKKSVEDGRKERSNLKCGICGEHGGDPYSVDFCHRIGLNYVSCSPFRVVIARLAGAQASIKAQKK